MEYEKQIKEAQAGKEQTLRKLKKQLRAEMFANGVRLDIAERGALLPEELSEAELTGILVKNARVLRGLNEAELSRRSGVWAETISRLESGQHKPRRGTTKKLAQALGVPPKQLDPQFVFARWPAIYQTVISEREVLQEREKVEAN